MFCYQCEQTIEGGCNKKIGVCGKNEDIASLQDIAIFGLKGVAAYAHHARELGSANPEVDAIIAETLYSTLTNVNFRLNDNVDTVLKVGDATIKVMDLLDKAHTDRLGVPEPVTVSEDRIEGKSILVSGHNLLALEELLKQTEGKGINIYTHSEMLPAHGYPQLKKYSHLKGNVGQAWHDQRRLFDDYPGAILMTTNCVMPVRGTYRQKLFTYDVTGVEECPYIEGNDFSPLIDKALSMDDVDVRSDKTLTTGFHHQTVLNLAPQIIDAVTSGKIKHFFVIAGCDAPGSGGDYFRELAELVPRDCVILTTSCGKFRFNDLEFGSINGGIPRYIDLGQCNNSISCVKIATALAEAFNCSVNDLPLSIALSWFEQKAVAILLGLFSLGVKNIYLGPKPPEFVTPAVLKVLQENFNLKFAGEAERDIRVMLQ